MNDQSPPQRVTRARATANTGTGVRTARIATAASKATAARSLSTTKRMAPVNDDQNEDTSEQTEDIIEPKQPKPRGRPRKVVAAQPESDMDEIAGDAPKPTRGRPRKTPEVPAPQPPRPRGRPRKVDTAQGGAVVVGATKVTRARTTTVSSAAAPKKSVQFEEPGKENIIPAPSNDKGKEKEAATGLRAKPLRKPPVPAARATRSQPKSATQKSPLSPKKTTQIAIGKDDFSDDELAGTGKTPTKSLAISPVKPPAGVFTLNAVKKLDFSNSSTMNRATVHNMSGSVMASPARRPPLSPFKESVKTSPNGSSVGDCLLRSPVKLPMPPPKYTDLSAPAASSLLHSPARRPPSPIKVAENGSPTRSGNTNWTHGSTPNVNSVKISRFATPKALTKGAARAGQILGSNSQAPTSTDGSTESKETSSSDPSLSGLKFSGRLSSIFPRDSNPAIPASEPETEERENQLEIEQEDAMVIDETITVVGAPVEIPYTNLSPPKTITRSFFGLRAVDENPFQDSDSEDELGSESLKRSGLAPTGLKTPRPNFASSSAPRTPFTAISKTPRTARSVAKTLDSKAPIDFTPLAKQLSDWMPVSPDQRGPIGSDASPVKNEADKTTSVHVDAGANLSPTKSSYFDDAMSICDEIVASAPEQTIEDDDFSPVDLDEEDYALAHEADEMSLLGPDEVANVDGTVDAPVIYEPESKHPAEGTADKIFSSEEQNEGILDAQQATTISEVAPSEASQEYGDENAIPIDPILIALDSQTPSTPEFITPKRVLSERVFHTVSKVPLKGEAPASPIRPSPVKRSASVSKLPNQRSSNTLSRSNTVISYSPSKRVRSRSPRKAADTTDACATPSKDNSVDWSTIGTPARTPRRDLNPALLKGAVVFVDVHTTEGADASGLFIELLTQMGARSVKRWDWNGNKDDGSKIGITHVVFKDGGRRTLQKAKETGGVISCVGVGWVLDCERENKWLDESAYAVDTGVVPRGGQRRRKSMEPRALENHNGTLVRSTSTTPTYSTALQSPSKDTFGIPDTPLTSKSRRRDSVQWERSPSSPSNANNQIDDQTLLLSPIPATPAQEAIAAYGQDVFLGEETPSANKTPYFFHKEQLVQNTAPQGKRYFDEPEGNSPGFLSEKKDESVMMRLMAARRKSLQWAPKVGSPLSQDEGW